MTSKATERFRELLGKCAGTILKWETHNILSDVSGHIDKLEQRIESLEKDEEEEDSDRKEISLENPRSMFSSLDNLLFSSVVDKLDGLNMVILGIDTESKIVKKGSDGPVTTICYRVFSRKSGVMFVRAHADGGAIIVDIFNRGEDDD